MRNAECKMQNRGTRGGVRSAVARARRTIILALATPLFGLALPTTALAADVISGVMLDDRGLPLRLTPIHVRTSEGEPLTETLSGDNGAYCVGHAAVASGGRYQVCAAVIGGKAACAAGRADTVAGTMLGADHNPLRHAELGIYDEQWIPVASGRTDGEGAYCISNNAIEAGRVYHVCVTPASVGSVAGGISGTMFGAESKPLPQADVKVTGPDGKLLTSERTAFDGRYCVSADEIKPGVLHRVCVGVPAGAATCSPSESTVSGAMLVGNVPVRNSRLTVHAPDGATIATGSTDDNGAYCIVDPDIEAGAVHDVCVDLPAHCACCCACTCAPPRLVVPPEVVLVPAAIGSGVLAASLIDSEVEREISPFR